MSRYTGYLCVSCEHPFKNDDDIVVCPDCGAPHHRSCYMTPGQCALAHKHSEDFVWQGEPPNIGNAAPSALCTSCNSVNPPNSRHCQMCGSLLKAPDDNSAGHNHANHGQYTQGNYGTFLHTGEFDQWEIGGVSAKELAAYTGDKAYYFLRQFKLIAESRRQLSWNWAALLFNFLYFFFRKMYKVGIVLLAFYIMSYVPSFLIYFGPTDATVEMYGIAIHYNSQIAEKAAPIMALFHFARVFVNLWCAVMANKVYLHTALTAISHVKNSTEELGGAQGYYEALYHQGRPNRVAVALLIMLFFMFYVLFTQFVSWEPL